MTGLSMTALYVNYTSSIASDSYTLSRSACNAAWGSDKCPSVRLVPYFEALLSEERRSSGGFYTSDTVLISLLSLETKIKPGNERLNMTDDGEFPMQEVLEGHGWSQSVS